MIQMRGHAVNRFPGPTQPRETETLRPRPPKFFALLQSVEVPTLPFPSRNKPPIFVR